MNKKFGSFIREYKIEDTNTIFYVRGLTVQEYLDIYELTQIDKIGAADTMFMRVALTGIVGWKDFSVIDEDTEEVVDLEFNEENLEYLPDQYLVKIGEYIYINLTMPSEDEVKKYRGYIRFKYYMSDDDNKSATKYFNCKDCIEHNLWVNRNCGFSQEKRDSINKKDRPTEDVVNKSQEIKSRYKSKNKRVKEKSDSKPRATLYLQGYEYPECPVSWVDPKIQEWADRLYYVAKANGLFFDGGLANQQNKTFELQRLISLESNLIEYENMKKQYDKK